MLAALLAFVLLVVASVLACKGDALLAVGDPNNACCGSCATRSGVSSHNVLGLAWSVFALAGLGLAMGFGFVFYWPLFSAGE